MSSSALRRRRRRRLALLGGIVLLVAGGVTGRYLMVRGDTTTGPDPARTQGLAAHEAGDHGTAIQTLTGYVARRGDDAEAAFTLAESLRAQAHGDDARLIEAVRYYRQALRAQPSHTAATRALVEVLADNPRGVEAEGIRLVDRLLRTDGDDPALRRARAVFMAGTGLDSEALEATRQYLTLDPGDVAMHRQAIDLMKRTGLGSAALLAYTTPLREARPNDAGMRLVEAYAHLAVGDRAAAADLLTASELDEIDDALLIRQRLELLDSAGLFPQSLDLLQSAHDAETHEELTHELIRRLYEAGDAEGAMALMPSPSERPRWQNVLATLAHLGRADRDGANALIDLIEQQDTAAARATAALLRAAATPDATAEAVVAAGVEIEKLRILDGHLDALIARAHRQLGNTESAVRAYSAALSRRPSWVEPCLELAALELQRGHGAAALRFAAAALQRRPGSLQARVLLAQALVASPAGPTDDQLDRAMRIVDDVQAVRPGEPRTLALRIELLARAGDLEAADRALTEALSLDPPLGEPATRTLLASAERYGLPGVEAVQAAYVARFGQTLPITMVKANRLAETDGMDAALSFFDAARPGAPDPTWDVNRAVLLERHADPRAADAWAQAADTWPDDLEVQRGVLASAAAWGDRELVDRAITRLQALAGERDAGWRIERARWMLSADDPAAAASRADELLDEALELRPDDAAALTLRARSQRLMGKPRLAVSLAQRATAQAPDHAGAWVTLAYAQRDAGSTEAAVESARRAAAASDAAAASVRGAAQLLIDQGRPADAATALTRLLDEGRADARDRFVLAKLFDQTRRSDRALSLAESLLAEPTPAIVVFAADLYARADRPDDAAATLDLLDTLDLTDTQRDTIRAAHAARYGSTAEADARLVEAALANPSEAAGWVRLVEYRLRTGQIDQALTGARHGLDAATGAPALAALLEHAEQLQTQADAPGVIGLALALLLDDAHRDAAADALRAIDETSVSIVTRADRLSRLADRSPGFEALQAAAVTTELNAGRPTEALARASASMERFRGSADAARLAARAYASTGRWGETLLAAQAWAERSAGDPVAADTLAARAHRELDRPAAAVALLRPYEDRFVAEPERWATATQELALAYAASGQEGRAEALLSPHLASGPGWRRAWLDTTVAGVTNTRKARAFLATADDVIPADASEERALLAQAYWTVGLRDSYRPFLDRGRALADELIEDPDAGATLWFFRGTVAEIDGDPATAERAYRRAVELDAYAAAAHNNLAMVLADHGGDLAEAEALAERAVELVPAEPNFYDTLAHVRMRAGRPEAARQAIDEAIRLDPGNPQWRARLNGLSSAAE